MIHLGIGVQYGPSSVLKNAQPARYGVKRGLKMLMYVRVHCAFSAMLALSRTRLGLCQQAASGDFEPDQAASRFLSMPSNAFNNSSISAIVL